MAVSNAFSTNNQYIKYKITVTEGAVSVDGNTSPVTVTVNFYCTNTGYETYGTGTVYCKINGTTYSHSVTSSQKIASSGINLFSKTVTIPHNADGSKTIYVSAWISHNQVTSSEQGFDVALTTIPRATTPTISPSSVEMGGTMTITMNRASDSFTHTLSYAFGNASGTLGSDLGTSYSWTVPLSLASQISASTSGTGTITCKTYSGSTLIGTKSVSFIATVPASVVPVINTVSITDGITSPNIASKFSAFVQGKSNLIVTTTASGAYGSTIQSCKVTLRDNSSNLLATYYGTDVTTDTLQFSGTVKVGVSVTDSRGRSASVVYDQTVLPYEPPKIIGFSAFRSNADGTVNYAGQYANIAVNFQISAVNNLNDKYYEILYRVKGSSTWAGTIASGNLYTMNTSLVSGPVFSPDNAYELTIRLWDFFVSDSDAVNALAEIPTAFTLIDFRSTGKGIAFGKASEKDCMEIALDVEITGELIQDARQTPTLQNGWVNYGSTYESVTYWKDSCGIVHLAGMIKSGTTTDETVIFTLPEGYRPRESEKFFAVSMNAICVIDIYSTGNVAIKAGANAGWLSLSGITFRSEN